MAKKVFAYRQGRSIKNCDPQLIGEELDRMHTEHGEVTPDKVLEEAQDQNSPLHPAFEWDDTEAARQHRLSQARRLITSVRILSSPIQTPVQYMLSVRTPQGRSYQPTIDVLSDEQLRARVMMEVEEAIERIKRKYANFKEVADLLSNLNLQAG